MEDIALLNHTILLLCFLSVYPANSMVRILAGLRPVGRKTRQHYSAVLTTASKSAYLGNDEASVVSAQSHNGFLRASCAESLGAQQPSV